MTFMPWNDTYRVGLGDIDEQHRWLFNATARLHEEVSQPAPSRAVIAEILEGLMDYTVNHFIMEEDLFLRHAYPQAQEHKALHDQFTAAIMKIMTEFENGAEIEHEVLAILNHWLIEHIMKADSAYVPFFNEKGAFGPHAGHA